MKEMKKVLFSALCVSAMLASCADDELVQNAPSFGNGEGEKINVTLAATYPEFTDEVGTRTIFGEGEDANKFFWTNDDVVGALKVAAYDGIVGNTFDSNYPFTPIGLTDPSQFANFATNTAVFAGQYVFYHQYDGNKTGDEVSSKNTYNVEYPAVQEIDPADPKQHLIDDNEWVSPVIKLGGIKYEDTNTTSVKFVGMNAILELTIANNSNEGDLVINKVELNGDQFLQSGTLDFKTATTFPVLDPNSKTPGYDYAKELDEAIKDMKDGSNSLFESTSVADDGTKIAAVVTGEGIAVAKGAKASVYVLVPAYTYQIGKAAGSNESAIETITVYTDKGMFTIDAEQATKDKEPTTVVMNRDTRYGLNPELKGYAKAVESFEINNLSEWNNAVAYAEANTNQKIEFKLMEDLTIDELPSCPIYVSGSKKLTLAAKKSFAPVRNSYFQTLVNNGTMELSELIYVNSLTNNGTVNVPESDNVKGAKPVTEYSKWDEKTFGVTTLSNQGTVNIAGQMTSATSGASWTNNAKTQTAAAGVINIADGAALNVQAANTVTNSGKIENNGTIALTAAFTNNGEIAIATATGKISSSKTSTKVTNNGTIALDAPVDVFEVAGKASTTSIVTNGTTGVTSAAIAPADVDDLDDIEEINSIEMSGAWDAESLKGMTDAWDNITMQTWNAATIDLGEVTANQFADVTSVIVKGNSALTNSTETAEELGLAAGATITVEGTLAVDEYVTIGKEIATSPVITVLGSMSNSGEVYATLTIGGGVPVNTTAMYTNEKGATTYAASAYKGADYTYEAISVYGTFINDEANDGETVKATAIQNETGKATIQGKWATQSPVSAQVSAVEEAMEELLAAWQEVSTYNDFVKKIKGSNLGEKATAFMNAYNAWRTANGEETVKNTAMTIDLLLDFEREAGVDLGLEYDTPTGD